MGVPTYLNENVFVDPICIVNEYKALVDEGIEVPPLYIDYYCKVITPYDVLSDSLNIEVKNNGTCGKGIHATFERYKDLDSKGVLAKRMMYINNVEKLLIEAEHYYKFQRDSELYKLFGDACKFIESHPETFKMVPWSPANDRQEGDNYDTVIWEGSQGLLLDMERGFMPHCTPSKTGLNGIPEYVLKESPEVYLVMRPYLTRHGNGYTPYRIYDISKYFTLEEPTNLDTGIQGVFKKGVFDFSLLNRVIDRHCLDNYQRTYNCKFNWVITHWDCSISSYIPIIDTIGEAVLREKEEFLNDLNILDITCLDTFLGIGENSNIIRYEE